MFTTTAGNIAAQRQASLFEEPAGEFELTSCAAPRKAPADGWEGLGGGPGGRNWAWKHQATGVVVRHCGHPTALRPYYVPEDPDWKHSTLDKAKAAALMFKTTGKSYQGPNA